MKTIEKIEYIVADIKCKKHEMKMLQRMQNKEIVKEYRKFFWLLDFMVCIIILMNFGAVVLTNVMLVEKQAESGLIPVHFEVNPTTAKIGGFDTLDDVAKKEGWDYDQTQQKKKEINKSIRLAIFFAVFWVILLTMYIWFRIHLYTVNQIISLSFVVVWYFTITGSDFWNNFGLWIGGIIF